MLSFISIGLFDEKDLTLRGIEEAKKSDKVYIELYTSKWHGSLKNLEKIIGKKITQLERSDLEENSGKIIQEAKKQDVSILIEGSALVQTTHLSLLQEARKLKIKTKIIHNASIISAVAETGLHAQKFGQYVTIPFPERTKGEVPESVFKIIKENLERGLHTLCLLDMAAEQNRYMTVNESLEILMNGKLVTENSEIVVFARAGNDKPLIAYGKVSDFIRKKIKDIPAVVIIPGKMHYTEREFLNLYSIV
ncbi:MAG: diphthine synthase [Nitrospirae bacterium RBG_13_43_8]|nr:MAG: diphthine synthase [Nitrospirae bacterium RBG_13_43_8]